MEQRRNSSYAEDLPAELAAMIASVKSTPTSHPAAAPTRGAAADSSIRYYASYADGSCSGKAASKFESWETSYDNGEECCEVEFSWDYESCISQI